MTWLGRVRDLIMAKKKYHNSDFAKSAYVWFKLLDKDGNIIRDYGMQGCFGGITYEMDKKTATIQVYRDENMMPYKLTEVQRWINDLNDVGFPCDMTYDPTSTGSEMSQEKWAKDTAASKQMEDMIIAFRKHGLVENPYNSWGKPGPQNYKFNVHLKHYSNKSHLFSTLTLIRMLSESTMSTIPELYFQMMDADPDRDKFEAIQDAHKGPINGGSHAVTYKGNGSNVSRKALMDRFKSKTDLHTGRIAIHTAWNG